MQSLVHNRIGISGPISFDVFMELCLYDPSFGFFSAGAVRPGQAGDFVTSPEISPLFGSLIGTWVSQVSPGGRWPLVEIGAGSGALLSSLAATLPDGQDTWAVERSEASLELIASIMPEATVAASISEVDSGDVVVVMNEVLDNVPAALVRRTETGWDEMVVDRDGDALVLAEVPARTEVAAWADSYLDSIPVGSVASAQLAASALMQEIFEQFDGVAVCVIDYGGSSQELSARTEVDLVRTYRHQRTGFDFLAHPGETDLTVDVNTDAIAAMGRAKGAQVTVRTQREFLNECGAQPMLKDIRDRENAAARAGDVMSQLKARSEAVGLRALVDPSGFGSFKVVTMTRKPANRDGAVASS
jgi:SAM-dependent MidA family methyltransferase